MSNVWIIRAGKNGEDQDFALREKCVVIGWGFLGNILRRYKNGEEVVKEVFKKRAERRGKAYASQPWHFASTVKKGEWVILPLKDERGNRNGCSAVGQVVGDYVHAPGERNGRSHQRPVKWVNKEFPDGDILHPLTNQLTVSKIKNSEEIIPALEGRRVASSRPPTNLKAFIFRHFRERAMEDLVEQILTAMRYDCERTKMSGDGGIDIRATCSDPLGLKDTVCVEVKGGQGSRGVSDIRGLKGAKQEHQKGLFVSWGGFGKPKNQEKLKEKFPRIRLWDAEDVVALVGEHYKSFDKGFKQLIPPRLVKEYNALGAEGVQ